MTRFVSITTLFAACVFAAPAAWAQSNSNDVRSVCPGAHDELPDALARTAQEHRAPASVAVQFQVQGNRVLAVQTQGGAPAQQRAVRRAVQGLACNSTGLQTVRLNLRFDDTLRGPATPLMAAAASTPAPNPR